MRVEAHRTRAGTEVRRGVPTTVARRCGLVRVGEGCTTIDLGFGGNHRSSRGAEEAPRRRESPDESGNHHEREPAPGAPTRSAEQSLPPLSHLRPCPRRVTLPGGCRYRDEVVLFDLDERRNLFVGPQISVGAKQSVGRFALGQRPPEPVVPCGTAWSASGCKLLLE